MRITPPSPTPHKSKLDSEDTMNPLMFQVRSRIGNDYSLISIWHAKCYVNLSTTSKFTQEFLLRMHYYPNVLNGKSFLPSMKSVFQYLPSHGKPGWSLLTKQAREPVQSGLDS